MISNAYLVSVARTALPLEAEVSEVASDVRVTPTGMQLIFRDPLNAYKLAAVTGATVRHGGVVSESAGLEGVHFPGGHVFLDAARRA